jgi:hypothetical protein
MEMLDMDEVANHHDEREYANDDFDDVFGSAPPSPTFEHSRHREHETSLRSGNLECPKRL